MFIQFIILLSPLSPKKLSEPPFPIYLHNSPVKWVILETEKIRKDFNLGGNNL